MRRIAAAWLPVEARPHERAVLSSTTMTRPRRDATPLELRDYADRLEERVGILATALHVARQRAAAERARADRAELDARVPAPPTPMICRSALQRCLTCRR